jgi:hypothetical protein
VSILAPDKPQNNETRLYAWAIRVYQRLAHDKPRWTIKEYLPGQWRLQILNFYDIDLGKTPKEIIIEARKWFKCIRNEEKNRC